MNSAAPPAPACLCTSRCRTPRSTCCAVRSASWILSPRTIFLSSGVQPKGEGTRLICSLREGGCIEMLGPLGNGFSLNDAKTVWAIGGGVGVAPMLYACREFSKSARVTASLGFRTRDMIFSERDFHESAFRLVVATDDGTGRIPRQRSRGSFLPSPARSDHRLRPHPECSRRCRNLPSATICTASSRSSSGWAAATARVSPVPAGQ